MAAESSLIVDGVDIVALSDDKLYEMLASFGIVVGPITETTRKIYQKRLAAQMGGDVGNNSQICEEPVDDDTEDVEPTQAYIDMLATGEKKVRQRRRLEDAPLAESSTYSTEEGTEDYTEGDFSATDDATPQAAYLSSGSPYASPGSGVSGTEQEQEQRGGSGVVLLVLLVLAALMVACGLMFGGEPDAFDSLETLAKEALQREDGEL